MIGITPQIMTDGMCGDYKEIKRISRLVYEWDSKAHVDGVIKNPTITVDGEVIMDKGRFWLE